MKNGQESMKAGCNFLAENLVIVVLNLIPLYTPAEETSELNPESNRIHGISGS
jgi:hypothetical protein